MCVGEYDSPLETLTRQLAPDRLPQQHIPVGQPASGKSSELTKLAAELKHRYDALVVRFDMTDNTDVERANPVEVIFPRGAALFKVAATELPGSRHPDRHLLENLTQGLEQLVHTYAENKAFEIDLDKLLAGLKVRGDTARALAYVRRGETHVLQTLLSPVSDPAEDQAVRQQAIEA